MDCGEVDPGTAGGPQPEPAGPPRTAGDPGRPVGGSADQLADRALPRGDGDRRRHRPAAPGPRPVGRRPPGRLPDRRRGPVPHRRQVDQLAELVDESHVDVYAFGLTTDFRTRLFPGTQRLLEVADNIQRVQVEVLCWCGLPGPATPASSTAAWSTRARRSSSPTPHRRNCPATTAHSPAVRYQVLCRRHYVRGTRPASASDLGSSPSPDHPSGGGGGRSPPRAMMNNRFDGIFEGFLSLISVTLRSVGMPSVAGHRVPTDTTTRTVCHGRAFAPRSRLGSVSYETERNTAPIERQPGATGALRATCSRCPSPTTPSSPTRGSASSTAARPSSWAVRSRAQEGQAPAHALGHAPGAAFRLGP